jgi:hypothetical protein
MICMIVTGAPTQRYTTGIVADLMDLDITYNSNDNNRKFASCCYYSCTRYYDYFSVLLILNMRLILR